MEFLNDEKILAEQWFRQALRAAGSSAVGLLAGWLLITIWLILLFGPETDQVPLAFWTAFIMWLGWVVILLPLLLVNDARWLLMISRFGFLVWIFLPPIFYVGYLSMSYPGVAANFLGDPTISFLPSLLGFVAGLTGRRMYRLQWERYVDLLLLAMPFATLPVLVLLNFWLRG